jgi:hypothetical protein
MLLSEDSPPSKVEEYVILNSDLVKLGPFLLGAQKGVCFRKAKRVLLRFYIRLTAIGCVGKLGEEMGRAVSAGDG